MSLSRRRSFAALGAAVLGVLGASHDAVAGIFHRRRGRHTVATCQPAPVAYPQGQPAVSLPSAQAPPRGGSIEPVPAPCLQTTLTTFNTPLTRRLGQPLSIELNGQFSQDANGNWNPVILQDIESNVTWGPVTYDMANCTMNRLMLSSTPTGMAGVGGTLTVTILSNRKYFCPTQTISYVYPSGWVTYTS